jgi:putative hemolysin
MADLLSRPSAIRFTFDWRRYRVSVAADDAARAGAYRLRHDVFHAELLGRALPGGEDRDDFDDQCDHLLVHDQASGDLVGTCRVNRGGRRQRFYTAGEFDLDGLLAQHGGKLEVGRTCLRRDHRNNLGLLALGRGFGRYAGACRARWVFGCASVAGDDVTAAARLCAWFRASGVAAGSFGARPRPDHVLAGLEDAVAALPAGAVDAAEVDEALPPLLRAYLRAGAALSAAPAHDPDFACLDFLTVIDLRHSGDNAFFGRLAPC